MKRVSAAAPGKIILLGEHAVIYGHGAIGLAIQREVGVQLTPGRGRLDVALAPELTRPRSRSAASPAELVDAALGELAREVDVEITAAVPPMAGLGSSAALAVALLRAGAAWRAEATRDRDLLASAIRVEGVAHGRSSGVDPAICLAGGLIHYTAKARRITRLTPGAPLWLVVGAKGAHGGTKVSVGGIATLALEAPHLVAGAMRALGACVRDGRRAIGSGDLALLGRVMNLAHGVLSGLGVVSDETEALIARARSSGALGAKMSGAGGRGGAFVALARDRRAAARIAGILRSAGALAWVERAG